MPLAFLCQALLTAHHPKAPPKAVSASERSQAWHSGVTACLPGSVPLKKKNQTQAIRNSVFSILLTNELAKEQVI